MGVVISNGSEVGVKYGGFPKKGTSLFVRVLCNFQQEDKQFITFPLDS